MKIGKKISGGKYIKNRKKKLYERPGQKTVVKLGEEKTKSKKTRSAGRFGARYGRSVRDKLVGVESKQRKKQKCPFCERVGAKRLSKGIWKCSKCDKKFAHNTYYLD